MKAVEWWLPVEKRTPQPKKRSPYIRGAKDYLTSFEVGEARVYDGKFRIHSMRCLAARLTQDYGCKYTFRLEDGVRVIRRIR